MFLTNDSATSLIVVSDANVMPNLKAILVREQNKNHCVFQTWLSKNVTLCKSSLFNLYLFP